MRTSLQKQASLLFDRQDPTQRAKRRTRASINRIKVDEYSIGLLYSLCRQASLFALPRVLFPGHNELRPFVFGPVTILDMILSTSISSLQCAVPIGYSFIPISSVRDELRLYALLASFQVLQHFFGTSYDA